MHTFKQPILKVENLTTGYGKKQVLFDISFEVNQSEIILLVGSNGSGKSTLLKTIYGILPQWNNGKIVFAGENVTGKSTSALLDKGLIYVPQKNNLFEGLTVKENLEMAGLTLSRQLLKHRIEEALSTFATLVPYLHQTPMKLSGGERQMLSLAMVTLHLPKMILVDEPFTGLSPQNITLVINNLKSMNERNKITLLIVEHSIKECLSIATKVIGLKLGNIFSEIQVNSSFNIADLKSVFI
ncbi:MAG TPA: ATP-binding cassette domain-containing protein [Saprospiraceae bacterium]|nr:ATP-binding cassette domain-containing protein [Saprospiraceae bacterium]